MRHLTSLIFALLFAASASAQTLTPAGLQLPTGKKVCFGATCVDYLDSSGGTVGGAKWHTVLDLDFRTVTPATLTGDGSFTIDGKTWTKTGSTYENATTEINATNGLVFNSNGGTPGTVSSGATATKLTTLEIPMTSLYSGFSLDTPIRVWSSSTPAGGATARYVSVWVWLNVASFTSTRYGVMSNGRTQYGNHARAVMYTTDTTATTAETTLAAGETPDVMAMFLPQGVGFFSESTLYGNTVDGAWPALSALLWADGVQGYQSYPRSYAKPLSSWKLALTNECSSGGSACTGTHQRIRVDLFY